MLRIKSSNLGDTRLMKLFCNELAKIKSITELRYLELIWRKNLLAFMNHIKFFYAASHLPEYYL